MGLPVGNHFMNSKERKTLLTTLNEQFGIDELPQGVYITNSKEKVFLLNRDIELIDYESLRIDSLGLYIGVWQRDGFRLSIEGSQLLAPLTKRNLYELDSSLKSAWLKGEDLPYDGDDYSFVIVTCQGDVLGCGKLRAAQHDKEGVILNYTPKARRLVVVNE